LSKVIDADICIIGAGSAGLSVAAGAAQLGSRVVLIEAHRMGGDCLNTGCVPSKALLAAAKSAAVMRKASTFGVNAGELRVDFGRVNAHVKSVIAGIAPHDSVERFTGLGCMVIEARAKFIDAATVEAGGQRVRARRFVIATGSRAAVPPIPGLDTVPYMTNETVFENLVLPGHLIVIGGGPIGCEMAQAHRRLGARVSVLDMGGILPKDDPEAVAVVRKRLVDEGVELNEGIAIVRVEKTAAGVRVAIADPKAPGAAERWIEGSHILVAAGRKPNIENLGLEAAGIDFTKRGITVDDRLRTTNKKVFAAGDVAGGFQFTHLAGYHAGIIIRNALFQIPAKSQPKALPWVTYTDPELAHVGQTEVEARASLGDKLTVLRASFADNDRARAEAETAGFMKVLVTPKGHIAGVTIVGAKAGELLLPWVLAMTEGLKIGAMTRLIAPYPTLSEISKRAASSYYTPKLFSPRTRSIVKFLRIFG
jgi:pyruvate/2-oxoglutarate dehydrogenase complex dihydrolipoamide dehydrogenase (E3) component